MIKEGLSVGKIWVVDVEGVEKEWFIDRYKKR
jgi:hypothetical protein